MELGRNWKIIDELQSGRKKILSSKGVHSFRSCFAQTVPRSNDRLSQTGAISKNIAMSCVRVHLAWCHSCKADLLRTSAVFIVKGSSAVVRNRLYTHRPQSNIQRVAVFG